MDLRRLAFRGSRSSRARTIDVITIGRQDDNAIVLDSPKVSRHQARVRAGSVDQISPEVAERYSANISPIETIDMAFKSADLIDHVHQVLGADGRSRDLQSGDIVPKELSSLSSAVRRFYRSHRPNAPRRHATSRVERKGVLPQAIYLEYSQERLASYGFQAGDRSRILNARNITLPGGSIEAGGHDIQIGPSGQFDSAQSIGDVILGTVGPARPCICATLCRSAAAIKPPPVI